MEGYYLNVGKVITMFGVVLSVVVISVFEERRKGYYSIINWRMSK